jgi:tetratricopeptide (TPR) repeat protein
MADQHTLWPNVEEIVLQDLKKLHSVVGPWDAVFFTGDLTQQGSPTEFAALERLLQKLWGKFNEWGFNPQLLAVPGNHDLVRPDDESDLALITLLNNWDLEVVQKQFWQNPDSAQRRLVSAVFEPFRKWWAETSIPKPDNVAAGLLPGDCSATFSVNGLKVGVAGLNSAYLQLAGGDFARRLHVDVRQVQAVCNGHISEWAKAHDACFLLTHHPSEWLTVNSEHQFLSEIHFPPERFVVHLFGHMHENRLTSVAQGGASERRKWQGSSLFGLELWGNEQKTKREHGYSLGELRSTDDSLHLRFWPRKALEKPGGGRKIERDVEGFFLDERDGGTEAVVLRSQSTRPVQPLVDAPMTFSTTRVGEKYDPRNPPFYVPYRKKGERVIGREEALAKVREQLTEGGRTAIGQTAVFQGLGGLGKTQLAVEYAHSFRDTYPNGVIWLTADQDIDAQLVDLAVKAQWVAPESEHSQKLEIARWRVRTYSDCLIVFDNLEDMAAIREYLPEPPAEPHILATSRMEQPHFSYVPIDLLDLDQSLRLLVQESRRTPETVAEWSAARAIASMLAGLPLALELAGAYLSRRPVPWHDYRALLEQNLRRALPQQLASLTGHAADIYSTLKITQQIYAEEPLLELILDVLTWSAPAPMSVELLTSLLGIENKAELIGPLGLGSALRILQHTPENNGYGIHRLVREVRREEHPLVEKGSWAAEICQRIADWFDGQRSEFLRLSRFEAEIDHLREWHAHSLEVAPKLSSQLTWLQAYPAFHREKPLAIKRCIELALKEYQQGECEDRQLLARLYNDLGYAFSRLGDGRRALDLAEQALEIQRNFLGELHNDTAMSLNNIASCQAALGRHQLALELAEQAYNIRCSLLGERHPSTATSLGNMAGYYYSLGDPRRAFELAEQVHFIRLNTQGERHPATAMSLDNLALYMCELGDPRRALEIAERVYVLRRDLFGDQHPHTAESLSSMADFHARLGDCRRALTLAEQSYAVRRDLMGEDHPVTALSLHKIGLHLHSLGRFPEAHSFASRALAVRQKIFGQNHPDTLVTLKLLSRIPGFRAPSKKKKMARRKR